MLQIRCHSLNRLPIHSFNKLIPPNLLRLETPHSATQGLCWMTFPFTTTSVIRTTEKTVPLKDLFMLLSGVGIGHIDIWHIQPPSLYHSILLSPLSFFPFSLSFLLSSFSMNTSTNTVTFTQKRKWKQWKWDLKIILTFRTLHDFLFKQIHDTSARTIKRDELSQNMQL